MTACCRGRLTGLVLASLMTFAPPAAAGALHRCDDGGGVSIYQTLPCSAGQRTVERREYHEPGAATGTPAKPDRSPDVRRRPEARADGNRSKGGSEPSRRVVAHECQWRGERWVQAAPCAATRVPPQASGVKSTTGGPSQRALDRDEACRRVRETRQERAPGERTADSVYRRNLLRDRGGC